MARQNPISFVSRSAVAMICLGAILILPARAAVQSPQINSRVPISPSGVRFNVFNARNPHLHGANNPVAEKEARQHKDQAASGDHAKGDGREGRDPHDVHGAREAYLESVHHWHHRWGYADWAFVHRGLATIRGQVRDASGRPVSNATVVLRGARGRILGLGAKHLTRSGYGGFFVMSGVRAGAYRVRAQAGKTNNHVAIRLHPGEVASVDVEL